MKDRIVEIIEWETESYRKFKHFEELTGISARKWQNLAQGKQRANEEMIEAIGNRWPQYAYWLVTGKVDDARNHTSPILERIAEDMRKAGKAA